MFMLLRTRTALLATVLVGCLLQGGAALAEDCCSTLTSVPSERAVVSSRPAAPIRPWPP